MTTTIANTEMAAAWDGEEGDEWVEHADRFDATGRFIDARFEAEVAIGPDEDVLDIGCGTGKSSRDAARRARSVLGVDLSSRMLEEAARRSRAEGLANVRFVRADAQVHPFEPDAHDLAISSFGAMFFGDPTAAFANIGRALRPRSRLALLSWRRFEDNEWLRVFFDALAAGRDLPAPPTGAPGPFGLADPGQVTAILQGAGFEDVALTPVDEPTWFGRDAEDAWDFVSGMGIVRGLSGGLAPDARAEALGRLRGAVAAHETPDGVLLGSAAWLITARRV